MIKQKKTEHCEIHFSVIVNITTTYILITYLLYDIFIHYLCGKLLKNDLGYKFTTCGLVSTEKNIFHLMFNIEE